MATETYKWFKPDTDLRADYGGAAIQANGDSAEVTAITLTQRYICREIGWPSGATRHIGLIGNDGVDDWLRVSDNMYSSISPHLSAAELATVVSSQPTGFTASSRGIQFQPHPYKTNVIVRGDSISAGLGTTTGDTRDIYAHQALNSVEALTATDTTNYREFESPNYYLANISLGGSSWANTVDEGNGAHLYPLREDLAYPQRTQTLCLDGTGARNIFVYWLGTNDLAYDTGLSAADAWSRAATRIAALAAEFPALKIILGTAIKRGSGSPLNVRINDYNVLARANYASAGAHVLMDFEADVSAVNISTGDTGNATYYTDTVHLTTAGHALLAPVCLAAIEEAEALF